METLFVYLLGQFVTFMVILRVRSKEYRALQESDVLLCFFWPFPWAVIIMEGIKGLKKKCLFWYN